MTLKAQIKDISFNEETKGQNMLTPEEIEQLEISREKANTVIEKGKALQRLLANPDYQLIISEGFFKEYPAKLAEAVANNTGAYDSDKLCEMLKGINVLKGYEFQIATNMSAGEQDLEDIETRIAESVKTEGDE